MNILSLFDGMSCGQIALNRAEISYDKYLAAEIDKHAITVTQANYPDTVQLGDITTVDVSTLPKIDLLIFGSPCQGFSFAGKGLNFDHPHSKLFFIAADIKDQLQAINPDLFFMMENVRMEKWCERIITNRLDVDPIFIDSALVSAQTRKRLYWTNILVSGKPQDRGIYLKDVLESEVDEKYYLKGNALTRLVTSTDLAKRFSQIGGEKAITSTARQFANWKGQFIKTDINGNPKANQDKASTFTADAHSGGNHSDMDLIITHNLQPRNGKGNGGKGHLAKTDQKSYCVDTGNSQAVQPARDVRQLNSSLESGGKQPYQRNRIYDSNGIAPAICADLGDILIQEPFLQEPDHVHGEPRIYTDKSPTLQSRMGTGGDNIPYVNNIRRLTEIEVERLQTVPDGYTNHVSSTQRYKMLGNGWTVDVVAWIFGFMKDDAPRNDGVLQRGLF